MEKDGHNDLPNTIRDLFGNMIYNSNFTFDTSLPDQVDLPRLKKGRVGVLATIRLLLPRHDQALIGYTLGYLLERVRSMPPY